MGEITLAQLQNAMLFIIAFSGAIFTIVKSIKNVFNSALKPIGDKIDKMDKQLKDLKEDDRKNGDMIYQMLDHLATNNNSGGMKKALDEYNSYYRHG